MTKMHTDIEEQVKKQIIKSPEKLLDNPVYLNACQKRIVESEIALQTNTSIYPAGDQYKIAYNVFSILAHSSSEHEAHLLAKQKRKKIDCDIQADAINDVCIDENITGIYYRDSFIGNKEDIYNKIFTWKQGMAGRLSENFDALSLDEQIDIINEYHILKMATAELARLKLEGFKSSLFELYKDTKFIAQPTSKSLSNKTCIEAGIRVN